MFAFSLSRRLFTDLDVQLERHRSDVGVEVERGGGAAAQPVGHVFSIGQRRAEGHDADGTLNLRGDVPHPGADDLQHRLGTNKQGALVSESIAGMKHEAVLWSYPILSSDEVRFVHNEKTDVLDVLPLLPATRQDVPFVGGADDDVTFSQKLQIRAGFSRQQHHFFVQDVLELLVPVDKHLRDRDPCDSR